MHMNGSRRSLQGMHGDFAGLGQAGLQRSPPKNKSENPPITLRSERRLIGRADTQHVPCKFFLQGQCQAGRMCPFSHDVESTVRPAPCKYFAKGGCKFGRKCALLHITPDGTVVNRTQAFGPAPHLATAQSQLPQFGQAPPPGLLSMQAHGLEVPANGDGQADFEGYQHAPRYGHDYSQSDLAYNARSPIFGSPTDENHFPTSPHIRGLSVLDAPLPNSFDSNGISMAARNGPFAASVPSRFGIDSPTSSVPRKLPIGNTALRDLHSSAFGDRGLDGVLAGSSPPSGPDEPLTFPKRSLHSDRRHMPRQQMISASLGTKLPTQSFDYSDDEDDFDRGEDLLPASLRELIPESRDRGPPRPRVEDENSPASFLAAQRRTLSGHGTPSDSKVGSPHSSSPSRQPGYSAWSSRNTGFGFSSSSVRAGSGDLSPTIGSPSRQASMSALTQELQRTRLDAARSQAGVTGISRAVSNGPAGRSSFDRAVSGHSVGRERIDEEQDLFDMDEVGDSSRSAPRPIPSAGNRNGAWSNGAFGSPPQSSKASYGAIGGHRTSK